jgi:hypothetical protein
MSEAGCDPLENGDTPEAVERMYRAELKEKLTEIELLRRQVERRDRMMRRMNEAWVRAAEEALAGDPRALFNKVQMFNIPPAEVVAS